MGIDDLGTFIRDIAGEGSFRIETEFGDGFVKLNSSEAERRQAKQDIRSVEDAVIEILRNSRDAHARTIFLACSHQGDLRKIICIDDGDGIPGHMHSHVFEPRVTSKLDTFKTDRWGVHGRGMALYSIAENAVEAKVAASSPDLGTSIVLLFDLQSLKEKTDQSTFPQFFISDKTLQIRGPKNILRTAAEFAFDSHHDCSVYLGSSTEIAACLYAYGCKTLSVNERVFCTDRQSLPLCVRLATAEDPQTFTDLAHALGLEISIRSARRIMDGTIKAIEDLYSMVQSACFVNTQPLASQDLKRAHAVQASDRKSALSPVRRVKNVSFDPKELAAFKESVSAAYSQLAYPYYLDSSVPCTVKVCHDGLRIDIPFVFDDTL